MQALAAQAALFPPRYFPPPAGGTPGARRYRLHADLDDRFALYLNALNPGTETPPHDHGTWAVIAAVAGAEENRLFIRQDGQLHLAEEVVVAPGGGLALMPRDIHAIRVPGDRPAWLLHLYGRALERQADRHSYDPATGAALPARPDPLDEGDR